MQFELTKTYIDGLCTYPNIYIFSCGYWDEKYPQLNQLWTMEPQIVNNFVYLVEKKKLYNEMRMRQRGNNCKQMCGEYKWVLISRGYIYIYIVNILGNHYIHCMMVRVRLLHRDNAYSQTNLRVIWQSHKHYCIQFPHCKPYPTRILYNPAVEKTLIENPILVGFFSSRVWLRFSPDYICEGVPFKYARGWCAYI